MHERIEQRLEKLRAEFAAGQSMMADLDAKQAQLRSTLLRISGAIQVLEELMDRETPASPLPDMAPEIASAATS